MPNVIMLPKDHDDLTPHYLTIYESKFGHPSNPEITRADSIINSRMMAACAAEFPLARYGHSSTGITYPSAWEVRIEDQNQFAPSPNYILHLGALHDAPIINNPSPPNPFVITSIEVPYNDLRSEVNPTPIIRRVSGTFTITVVIEDLHPTSIPSTQLKSIAKSLAERYGQLLDECIPTFYIEYDVERGAHYAIVEYH